MTPILLLALAAPPDIYGVVVGYNLSDDPNVAPLRYADDDAVKNAQLLQDLGAKLVLLTELDEDSARLYDDVDAARPTRRAVETAFDELDKRIAESHAAGRRAELMFFYGGHGDVKNNEGYIQLAGGRLYRDDFRKLIMSTSADAVHVVVDACKSYFLLFPRGPGGERKPASLELKPATLPDRIGLLLSTSSAQDSHEWEAYQSGVFSHEVRSALRGAADLDRDGLVTYEETAAFVYGANRAIVNARYRPRFFVRSPKENAFVQLAGREGARLSAGPGLDAHLFLEDAHGNRVADFHPTREQQIELLVPAVRPLFVRDVSKDVEYVFEQSGPLLLGGAIPRPVRAQTRGAEHVAFQALFLEPFDDATMTAYRLEQAARPRLVVASEVSWPGPALAATSIVLAATGGVLTALALRDRRYDDTTPRADRVAANRRIDRLNTFAVVAYTLAGTALAGWLTWTFWPDDNEITVIAAGSGVEVAF